MPHGSMGRPWLLTAERVGCEDPGPELGLAQQAGFPEAAAALCTDSWAGRPRRESGRALGGSTGVFLVGGGEREQGLGGWPGMAAEALLRMLGVHRAGQSCSQWELEGGAGLPQGLWAPGLWQGPQGPT